MNTPYVDQLAEKRRAILEELRGVGVSVEDLEVHPSPLELHYRNKAIYPLQPDPRRIGGVRAGFYRRGTHDLVPIEECRIQEPCLTTTLAALRGEVERLDIEPYDEAKGTGFARALFGRLATGTGELMLGISTRGGAFAAGAELARRAARAAQGLRSERGKVVKFAGFVRSIQDESGNRLLGERCVPLRGSDVLEERFGRLSLRIGMASFFQVNTPATLLLYQKVALALGEGPFERVIDAYAGIGSLALWIAGSSAEVWAIESGRSSVRDARENFRRAGLDPERILEGRVEDRLGEVPGPADAIVVDPPRSGLSEEVREALCARRPARLIYVSCNPQSFARDARSLIAKGWRLDSLEGVDLFPHTKHVELVAVFL